MTQTASSDMDKLREKILSRPDVILEDRDLMRALIDANERAMGGNIVDLRGIAMQRLEQRLDRLEDTHRSVIAAAYENLAGTNQVHRAILTMLEPRGFESFLRNLGGEVAQVLRLDALRLVLESHDSSATRGVSQLHDVLAVVPPGFVDAYASLGRAAAHAPARQVLLRQTRPDSDLVYGSKAPDIRSEAVLRLDLGSGRLPGMLVMGAEDPHQFNPSQGTDLLAFFAGVFERQMRQWLD